jgi:hypothetical protein
MVGGQAAPGDRAGEAMSDPIETPMSTEQLALKLDRFATSSTKPRGFIGGSLDTNLLRDAAQRLRTLAEGLAFNLRVHEQDVTDLVEARHERDAADARRVAAETERDELRKVIQAFDRSLDTRRVGIPPNYEGAGYRLAELDGVHAAFIVEFAATLALAPPRPATEQERG